MGERLENKEQYLRNRPEEIGRWMSELFEKYAQTGDTGALLKSLRMICRVKGVALTAANAGMTRNGLQKALRDTSQPKFDTVNSILQGLGYKISLRKLKSKNSKAVKYR